MNRCLRPTLLSLALCAALPLHASEAEATTEQFQLLRRYLTTRHPTGGMSEMGWLDYVAMVEDTSVRTHLIEHREPPEDKGPGRLLAVTAITLTAIPAFAQDLRYAHVGAEGDIRPAMPPRLPRRLPPRRTVL